MEATCILGLRVVLRGTDLETLVELDEHGDALFTVTLGETPLLAADKIREGKHGNGGGGLE